MHRCPSMESHAVEIEITTAQRVPFLAVNELALRDAAADTRAVRYAALGWPLEDVVDFPRIYGLAGLEPE